MPPLHLRAGLRASPMSPRRNGVDVAAVLARPIPPAAKFAP
ncbi:MULTISPECIES: hypothetical protein [Paracoccus]|nr:MULTISPECIES: hypothetical protein [Paracoccus]MBB4628559.1 hypothetical protein [Paracoccus denitrificans]MCU7430548.1 hypothetical protein [Paracoccus denitrificans]MDK8873871.1 hypothetical protein [Paracoccus sp. SSJ]WQO35050.1 hypothetical protein U0005_19600 [Paracoccus denitrificans]